MNEWERCRPLLEPALDGTWTMEAVRDELLRGRAKLWPMERSAAVTQLHDYPAGRVCRVWLAGGDLDELRDGLEVLDRYAREQRCTRIEIEGRPGWERVLDGYEKRRVILTKDI